MVTRVEPEFHLELVRPRWGHEIRPWRRDESRFTLTPGSRRIRVWRRRRERVITRNLLILWNCLVTDGVIMVWGARIWHNDRTDLVVINGNLTGLRYRDEILVQHVLPYAAVFGDASC